MRASDGKQDLISSGEVRPGSAASAAGGHHGRHATAIEGTMLTVESMGKTVFFVGRKHIVFEMSNLEFPSSPRVQSMIDSDRYG